MKKLKFAIPKGSLEKDTYALLKQAGYTIKAAERSYRPWVSDPEISLKILRPQEIPTLVDTGAHDIGITGTDWIAETRAKNVVELTNLEYGLVRLVLVVPNMWRDVNSFSDLLEKLKKQEIQRIRIGTEYITTSTEYIMKNPDYISMFGNKRPEVITPWYKTGDNSLVQLILSFGATEAKPPEDAEAIIDNTETGTTIEENNLKIAEVIDESTAVLIANKQSLDDPWRREKIQDVLNLLKGAVDARKKLHLFVNVQEDKLQELLAELPALKRPTISPLANAEGWYALNTVIPKEIFLKLVPTLRRLAQGLVVYEPRQVLTLEETKQNFEKNEK